MIANDIYAVIFSVLYIIHISVDRICTVKSSRPEYHAYQAASRSSADRAERVTQHQ